MGGIVFSSRPAHWSSAPPAPCLPPPPWSKATSAPHLWQLIWVLPPCAVPLCWKAILQGGNQGHRVPGNRLESLFVQVSLSVDSVGQGKSHHLLMHRKVRPNGSRATCPFPRWAWPHTWQWHQLHDETEVWRHMVLIDSSGTLCQRSPRYDKEPKVVHLSWGTCQPGRPGSGMSSSSSPSTEIVSQFLSLGLPCKMQVGCLLPGAQ